MGSNSAVFVGDGSLLVQCAQAWKDAGQRIVAVASHSPQVIAWAQGAGVALADWHGDQPDWPGGEIDYLFSVANLVVLPSACIRRARLAINFHDGPLPRYAGLNTPAWALLAGETSHAITWHEMTEAVDAGRIVRQRAFAIAPADTALDLNTRCYEAGLAAFRELVDEISRGTLTMQPQQGERRWFGKDRRPDLLGTLDLARGAEEIARVVRALDFGAYANPLARPRLYTGTQALPVQRAQVLATRSGIPPGTVLAQSGDGITVATADLDLLLSGIAWPEGTTPAVGTRLPLLGGSLRERLQERTTRTGRGERHWSAALSQLAPVDLPYPRSHSAASQRLPLRLRCEAGEAAAGLLAWIAALSGQEQVSLSFTSDALQRDVDGLAAWFTPWVPLSLHASPGDSAQAVRERVAAALQAAHEAGPLTRDLPSRLGERHPPMDALARVAIALGSDAQAPAGCELLLQVANDGALTLVTQGYEPAVAEQIGSQLTHWLSVFVRAQGSLASLALSPTDPAQHDAQPSKRDFAAIHAAIAAQAARTPDATALEAQGEALSYAQLLARAESIAATLAQRGVQGGAIVGIALDRRTDLVTSLLAVLQRGAAYLPLDPDYPAERIAHMVRDSGTPLVITTREIAQRLALEPSRTWCIDSEPAGSERIAAVAVQPDTPAYVIYTSGSTGLPKGVVVTHGNVANFFAGMDERVAHDAPGRWLAVTSLSFDISVLELCWTLARGFAVVLHSHTVRAKQAAPSFSLFYFASDHASRAQDRYRLLIEGAKFADANGFEAVWTPERHFHAFGGLYPNPAVTGAAIAACTSRVQIRAGSCVLPLHHPIRVAEEWAFVDNISGGRVGISFASGWQPNDFVLAPQNFADRKNGMLAGIDTVRRLWRGEKLPFPGPDGREVMVQTLPRPVQPELPVWVTAAGNPETFAQAGRQGCHLLTHLLGQTVEDVANKLRVYRMAWHEAGHTGQGRVTLMLHTFIGDDDDAVRETVRRPMKDYLRSSVDLIRQAAWSFPTFVQRAAQDGRSPVEVMESAPLSEAELDALLEHAFNRYYGTSALFGTRERCLDMVRKLQAAGVDEIACLVDFGVETQQVLDHLHHLKSLMDAANAQQPAVQRVSVAEAIVRHDITHLQCTPSQASMLVADAGGREALKHLRSMMVGGEALPMALASQLRALLPGQLLNMYGPTETTIWSTTCELRETGDFVPLGEPIANTRLRIRNAWGLDCPPLVPGELLIGGAGVAQGYWQRPELTAQRFVDQGGRYYRTGDLVRRHADGRLEFLGRIDHQVKIRGHRIELGEIEAALARQPGVKDAVAIAREDAAGDKRLLAYVTARPGERVTVDALKEALAARLPEFMVPQSLVLLPALPMTPNGKVDRKALPEPLAIPVRAAVTSPASEMEKTLAAIWQDVLGLPQVGTTDNFFDLGGHSLLVVQVQRRLREACGREVSITDMFRLPTIKSLADHLGGAAPAKSAVDDGLLRAQARRAMRSRVAPSTPVAGE